MRSASLVTCLQSGAWNPGVCTRRWSLAQTMLYGYCSRVRLLGSISSRSTRPQYFWAPYDSLHCSSMSVFLRTSYPTAHSTIRRIRTVGRHALRCDTALLMDSYHSGVKGERLKIEDLQCANVTLVGLRLETPHLPVASSAFSTTIRVTRTSVVRAFH